MKPDAIFTHSMSHISKDEILTLAVECGLFPGEAMKNLWWLEKFAKRTIVDEQRRLQKKVTAVVNAIAQDKGEMK